MKRIITIILAALAIAASAQEFNTSYYSHTSVFRHQMNPALLDSGHIAFLIGNISVGATGNVGLKNFVFDAPAGSAYKKTTFMHPSVSAGKFLGDLPSTVRLDNYININVLSVGFRAFGGNNVIEVNARSESHVSVPDEVFGFMKETGKKEHYNLKDIAARSVNYAELALGHSHKIDSKWTVGGKIKFLFGLAYANLDVNKLDVTMNGSNWIVDADAKGSLAVMKSKYNFKDEYTTDGRRRFKDLDVKGGLTGFGMAFDMGATYKLDDDWTFSAALTDLGFINWSKAQKISSHGRYDFDGFTDIYAGGSDNSKKLGTQFEDLGDDLENLFSPGDDGTGSVSQGLAATLRLGAEYNLPVYRPLSFGFLFTQRFFGTFSYTQAMLSAGFRPASWFELNLNTALGSTGLTAGGLMTLHAKGFNFFVGCDYFMPKLSKQFVPLSKANASLNVGFNFPFYL